MLSPLYHFEFSSNSHSAMETPLYFRSKPAAFASSCDAVLVVQGVEFAVHMDVLSCHCGFFASLFEDFGPSGGFTPTPVPKSR